MTRRLLVALVLALSVAAGCVPVGASPTGAAAADAAAADAAAADAAAADAAAADAAAGDAAAGDAAAAGSPVASIAGLQAAAPPGTDLSATSGSDPVANGTRIVHPGDELALQSGPGQAVRGRSDLPAGTELTVRLQSADADSPFLRSASTIVDDGGAFRAVFDLSEIPSGATLDVVVHRNGSAVASATAAVVACSDDCPTATPATPSAVVTADGGDVVVEAARGQAVRGRTNLPPGSELLVRLRSSSGRSPFIKSTTAVVDGNGTFRSVFDFADAPSGVEFDVSVVSNGTELTTARGHVACDADCPTVTPTGETGGTTDVGVGVVQVENGSVARIGIDLPEGDAATLAVGGPTSDYVLAVAVRDDSGDGSVVVRMNTSAASGGGRTVGVADPGDYFRVLDERGHLAPTEYRLVVHPPDNESATLATGLLVVTQDGTTGTPFITGTAGPGAGLPLGSAVALLVGGLLGVAGLAFLLGLVEL